jgi:Tfp pilus assembly protein PilO
MHSQELKLLSAISAFCLMALVSLAVASFVYSNTQDHLLRQANAESGLSSKNFPTKPQQVASADPLQDQLLATRSSMV